MAERRMARVDEREGEGVEKGKGEREKSQVNLL
jgi:hypothetical protein